MSAHSPTIPLHAGRPLRQETEVAVPGAVLRLAAFFALALFGMGHWTSLVRPGAGAEGFAAVVAAAGAALVLIGLQDVADRRPRRLALGAVVLALVVVGFRTAGVPARMLVPDAWDELVAGLRDGISGMPAVTVPYRGVDEWIRSAILLGGTLLTGLAALLAFWPEAPGARAAGRPAPGSPLPAAIALSVLYAVPIVEHAPQAPWLGGAVFAILLGALLWLERLRSDQLGVAAVCLLLATTVGLVVAPRLDATRPWIDYQALAENLQPKVASTFSWNHTYGPLGWPREGREVLRVKSPVSAYWKATTLDRFDGVRWLQGRQNWLLGADTEFSSKHREWYSTVRVVMRGMSSREFVAAGTTTSILPPAPDAVRTGFGTWAAERGALKRGTSYQARVYVPKPSETDMRDSGTAYPGFARDFLSMELPQSVVRAPIRDPNAVAPAPVGGVSLRFPIWSEWPYGVRAEYHSGFQDLQGQRYLESSGYRRVWELAKRMRAQAGSPYQYVVAVRDRVQKGATYSESPSPHRIPLASFLTDDPVGYCQQFSGSMALLLRMGGVPARVASGFSPGRFDRKRDDYVVRDLDAHSWVEVYFPGIGWTTWDPTPAASPARSQSDDTRDPAAPSFSGADRAAGDVAGDVAGSGAAPGRGGPSAALIVAALLLAGMVVAGSWTLVRRGRIPGGALAPELAELQRALHRSGRTPPPRTTLTRLEQSLGGSPAARDYLRAVRRARYAGPPAAATGPTSAQRRALRRELAAGLGVRGWLRALWALPPRTGLRRRPDRA